jgi:hypothetical protein
MPVIKSARPWDNTAVKLFLSLGGVWLVFMVVLVNLTDNVSFQKWGGFVSFAVFVVTFVVSALRLSPKFRCPDCGAEVQEPLETTAKGGEPLLQLCSRCDVLWHVGNVREPD